MSFSGIWAESSGTDLRLSIILIDGTWLCDLQRPTFDFQSLVIISSDGKKSGKQKLLDKIKSWVSKKEKPQDDLAKSEPSEQEQEPDTDESKKTE